MRLSLKQIEGIINGYQNDIYTNQCMMKDLEWGLGILYLKFQAANAELVDLQLTVLPSKAKDEEQELILKIERLDIELFDFQNQLEKTRDTVNILTLKHKMLLNKLEYVEKIMDTSPGWY